MKNKILKSALIISVFMVAVFSADAQIKKNFRGTWSFNAPDAPEGFQEGLMTISKDSVWSKYPDNPRLLPSSDLSFRNDTLTFVFIPAVDVTIKLGATNKSTLTGKANWLSDESVITLTKILTSKAKKQKVK